MGWEKIINKEWKYDEQAAIIRGDKEQMESLKESINTTEVLVEELKIKAKEIQSQILDTHAQSLLTNLDNIKIELDKTEQAHKERQQDPQQGYNTFRPGSGPPKMPGEPGYSPSRTMSAIQNDPRAR